MYIFKHWRYGYHSLFVNNVVWSNIFVPEKKVYSVDNFLITQYCVNKLATAILNKFLFVTFNSPGSQEPFSTPPGSPEASDNAPRVTRSQWQCPPGHQEQVTTPSGSPGASDNALRVTRSQHLRPGPPGPSAYAPGLQGAIESIPKPPRASVRTNGSPGAASMPQDLQEEMDTVTADSPPCSHHVPWLVTFSPLLLLFPSSTVELILSLKLNPSLNSSRKKEKKNVHFKVSNLIYHLK